MRLRSCVRAVILCLLLCLAIAMVERLPGGARAEGGAMDLGAIDRYIAGEMRAARVPGLALAIVQDGRIVYLQGYGAADPSGRPVTPQTPFIIGSLTKSFTALAVMHLVEAGKIDLDAPVQRYLLGFRLADPAASAQITVRQLLNQTSGIAPGVTAVKVRHGLDCGGGQRHPRGRARGRRGQLSGDDDPGPPGAVGGGRLGQRHQHGR